MLWATILHDKPSHFIDSYSGDNGTITICTPQFTRQITKNTHKLPFYSIHNSSHSVKERRYNITKSERKRAKRIFPFFVQRSVVRLFVSLERRDWTNASAIFFILNRACRCALSHHWCRLNPIISQANTHTHQPDSQQQPGSQMDICINTIFRTFLRHSFNWIVWI